MTLYQSKNVPHESYEHYVLPVCQLNEGEKGCCWVICVDISES